MERLEVKQQIASLVKELEELDTKIIDPIERSEYKQQLNKQLRLLKKREIIAEIEQEQKDLQSIQSESSLNQDSLADNSQVLASTLQQDNTHTRSNEFSTETKLQQDTQVNQVDESSYEESPSNISLSESIHSTTTSDNSNSNKSVTAWIKIKPLIILGLIFGSFVITAFIINSNSTRQAEEARLQELARQETEKARQERIKAEQERQAAIRAKEEAEKARQEAIDLIKNNSQKQSLNTSSPKDFIREHYLALNNRNYDLTWQHLTPEFQIKGGGFYSYTDWWNSVERIEIGQIKVLEHNNYQAVVDAQLKYFMKRGTVYKDPKSRIYLIWDDISNSWLFENKK